MGTRVVMSDREYETQLWVLNALGTVQKREYKTVSPEEIRTLLIDSKAPFDGDDLDLESIEQILKTLERKGVVEVYPHSGEWILNALEDIENG